MIRTVETEVVFRHAFRLPGMAGPQPPGAYALTADQEELHGVSFVMFRTFAVFLRLPALGTSSAEVRQVPVRMHDLDACVRADLMARKACALPAPA